MGEIVTPHDFQRDADSAVVPPKHCKGGVVSHRCPLAPGHTNEARAVEGSAMSTTERPTGRAGAFSLLHRLPLLHSVYAVSVLGVTRKISLYFSRLSMCVTPVTPVTPVFEGVRKRTLKQPCQNALGPRSLFPVHPGNRHTIAPSRYVVPGIELCCKCHVHLGPYG